jgi:hypothetical protein
MDTGMDALSPYYKAGLLSAGSFAGTLHPHGWNVASNPVPSDLYEWKLLGPDQVLVVGIHVEYPGDHELWEVVEKRRADLEQHIRDNVMLDLDDRVNLEIQFSPGSVWVKLRLTLKEGWKKARVCMAQILERTQSAIQSFFRGVPLVARSAWVWTKKHATVLTLIWDILVWLIGGGPPPSLSPSVMPPVTL